MKTHPYLRAYMAGITIPSVLLLLGMTMFIVARHVYDIAIPLERVIVFPMAIIPNLWGLWNMIYIFLKTKPYRYLSLGFHGALLTFVQIAIAFGISRLVKFDIPEFITSVSPLGFPILVIVFYMAWKHLVGFFNGMLGID